MVFFFEENLVVQNWHYVVSTDDAQVWYKITIDYLWKGVSYEYLAVRKFDPSNKKHSMKVEIKNCKKNIKNSHE